MRILKEGDRSSGLCEECRKRVGVRYEYRAITLEESNIEVCDVLVAVCDDCGSVVSIPAQSFPRLKEARAEKDRTVEARIPLELDDVMRLISDHFNVSNNAFRAYLLRYYLHLLGDDERFARRVKRLSEKELALLKSRTRVSLRVSNELWTNAWSAGQRVGIGSWAELLKGIVLAAQEDVLGKKAPRRSEDLECIAAST
jgi:hypothetical protein